MEEVQWVRDALGEALTEIDPQPFRTRLERTLDGRPLTPAILTVRTARALDGTVSVEEAATRGADVQLTYEGLRLTRRLVREEPWPPAGEGDPDVDVVAAEVLVARGLNGLAHTGVRERVVEIVRRFGRSHATERDTGEPSLEADFVVLAVTAGADLATAHVPPGLVEYARDLGVEIDADPLPSGEAIADVEDDVRRILAASEGATDERSRPSTMDP